MFVRSVSSEPEQLKDRGNIFTDSIITAVRAETLTLGALAQTHWLCQDNGVLSVCVCVFVCPCEVSNA